MKIYTKTGDKGQTSLVGGKRVSKTHVRLEAYGTVDELNSYLGLCIACIEKTAQMISKRGHKDRSQEFINTAKILKSVQHKLFNIGSLLACEDPKISDKLPSLEETEILALEKYIDKDTAVLAPLKEFILPGGSLCASHLHVARTLARRAERLIVGLDEQGEGSAELHPLIVPYINRLSDYLFVLARKCNHLLDRPDVKWMKES